MIPDLLLALGIFIVTVLSGMPFALTAGRRTLTRIAFSFALGYVLLSLAGILGALLGIDPILRSRRAERWLSLPFKIS
ncbi:MAG TPA: hypothetical protein PLW21_08840, partial [Methanothrix sp.]|nr:hypothetical protein [Methanothrix sp.]